MTMKAELRTEDGAALPVVAAALFSGVCRFPQLFVLVESEAPLAHGRYSFTLEHVQPQMVQTPLLESSWHTLSIHQGEATRHLLRLSADPDCLMQIRPFAANQQDAEALLTGRLGEHIHWQGIEYEAKPLEALLSQSESLEQLARRVAQLTNDIFVLRPGIDDGYDTDATEKMQWRLSWANSAQALARAAQKTRVIDIGDISEQLRSHTRLEPHLQQFTLPTHFDRALLEVSTHPRVRQVSRPVQLGTDGATALLHGPALNEKGEPLTGLHLRWCDIARTESLEALWRSGVIRGAEPDSSEHDALVLSSLFIYDNDAAHGRTNRAINDWFQWLGCEATDDRSAQGWLACCLAMPLTQLPADKLLLASAIDSAQPEAIWSRMIERLGCGHQALSSPPVMAPGPVSAVVVNRPDGEDPVSRTRDKKHYRTKIWVRVLGTDADVEVDWATPLACYGGAGDLILVPEANTLGYLQCQQGFGAPLFYAMTHYRDDPVSGELDPGRHTHGLITNGGLLLREVNDETMIHAEYLVRQRSLNHKRETGT
jgi:hypothetical protein